MYIGTEDDEVYIAWKIIDRKEPVIE